MYKIYLKCLLLFVVCLCSGSFVYSAENPVIAQLRQDIQYAELASSVYNDYGAPAGWKRLKSISDDLSGFYAAVFAKEDITTGQSLDEWVLAFRGTDAEFGDISTDVFNGTGLMTRQYSLAADYAKDIKPNVKKPV